MKKFVFTTCALFLSTSAVFAESNSAFCERMYAADKLEGHSVADCECVYGKADEHLTPEMKAAFQKSHEEGVEGPELMQEMMATGDPADIMTRMQAYAGAIEGACNMPS